MGGLNNTCTHITQAEVVCVLIFSSRIYLIVARLIGVAARLLGIRILPAWGVMFALFISWPILPLLIVIAYIGECVAG